MCGIVGILGTGPVAGSIVAALKRLHQIAIVEHSAVRADCAVVSEDITDRRGPHRLHNGLGIVGSCSGDRLEIMAHGRVERDLVVVRHTLAAGEKALGESARLIVEVQYQDCMKVRSWATSSPAALPWRR